MSRVISAIIYLWLLFGFLYQIRLVVMEIRQDKDYRDQLKKDLVRPTRLLLTLIIFVVVSILTPAALLLTIFHTYFKEVRPK